MTLNEKYCDLLDNDEGFDNQLLADRCEFMAEKFAIGFVQWLNEIQSFHSGENAYYYGNKWYNYQEIVEIYKKRKR